MLPQRPYVIIVHFYSNFKSVRISQILYHSFVTLYLYCSGKIHIAGITDYLVLWCIEQTTLDYSIKRMCGF